MALNPSSIASQAVPTMGLAVLEMVSSRPDPRVENVPPEPPGKVVGYYDGVQDKVELFVSSPGGTFWIEVG